MREADEIKVEDLAVEIRGLAKSVAESDWENLEPTDDVIQVHARMMERACVLLGALIGVGTAAEEEFAGDEHLQELVMRTATDWAAGVEPVVRFARKWLMETMWNGAFASVAAMHDIHAERGRRLRGESGGTNYWLERGRSTASEFIQTLGCENAALRSGFVAAVDAGAEDRFALIGLLTGTEGHLANVPDGFRRTFIRGFVAAAREWRGTSQ